jgi:serine/threonine protein kinase
MGASASQTQPCIVESDVAFNNDDILGSGSFGVVRKGSWLGMCVAIKSLTPDAAEVDPNLLDSFERELRLLAEMRHPNIIALFGSFRSTCGQLHVVMEFGDGGCLASHLRMCGNLGRPIAFDGAHSIALDVARGLLFLHEGLHHPVVHCDLKSANVIICRGVAKLADFGVARKMRRNTWLGRSGAGFDGVLGSIQWLPSTRLLPCSLFLQNCFHSDFRC